MAFQDRKYDRGPREMHKAICADCKKECEVPFKPREDRPVYCRDCFPKHKDSGR
ncbi:MAG: CxxC-x17-CxxC domain-containing protein [Acidobacteriota bacterium]|jgi:CxxC-x17-CxxC domain-containing protein